MDLNNEIGKPERSDERITELNQKVNDLYGQIMGDDGMDDRLQRGKARVRRSGQLH